MTEHTQDQREPDRDGEPGLTADHDLTQFFEDLKDALHGAMPGRGPAPLTWNGVEETTVTFDSIKSALKKAVPPDRPAPNPNDQSGTSQAGG